MARNSVDYPINYPSEASGIFEELWVGSAPPITADLSNWDVLVLLAEEYQPASRMWPEIEVMRYPFYDTEEPLDADKIRNLSNMADNIIEKLRDDKKVLITCLAGMNRSAFLTCLVLCRSSHRFSGKRAIEKIRSQRLDECLSNQEFCRYLIKTYR